METTIAMPCSSNCVHCLEQYVLKFRVIRFFTKRYVRSRAIKTVRETLERN